MSNAIATSAPAPLTFNFNQNAVRTVLIDSEPWFCAKDVCEVLGYANHRKTLQDNCKEKGVTTSYTLTDGGRQSLLFINEPNVYRLIIRSRKPEAEKFETWLMEEVLPQIRKTGVYCPVITLTPEQQRQIQVAVAGKALGSSVAFRSIYRILKDHFKVGSYKQIPSIRFSEAIEVIQNVRLRLTNVDDKTDSVDVCTITFTELNNLASLARLFLIAKPEMLRIYKVLSELDSPLAPRVYSLATEPVFAFGLLERLFSRHGIDIRDCQKQLAR